MIKYFIVILFWLIYIYNFFGKNSENNVGVYWSIYYYSVIYMFYIPVSLMLSKKLFKKWKKNLLELIIYLSLGFYGAIMLIRELSYIHRPEKYWDSTNKVGLFTVSGLSIICLFILLGILARKHFKKWIG